jgi:hypothetical protein
MLAIKIKHLTGNGWVFFYAKMKGGEQRERKKETFGIAGEVILISRSCPLNSK